MEGLRKRLYVLAGLFAAIGIVFLALPSKAESVVTESWMENHGPEIVDGFEYVKSAENPKISYKSDKGTYEQLRPFGIVARKYRKGERMFDVVLIAGNDKENFHDPHVCFRAQGWTFDQDQVVNIPTKTRGNIPATLAQISSQGKKTIALFFYRGPKGFYPSTPNLGAAMLLGPLTGNFQTDAVFYRFMPEFDGAQTQDVIDFAGKFMDTAYKPSNGYF